MLVAGEDVQRVARLGPGSREEGVRAALAFRQGGEGFVKEEAQVTEDLKLLPISEYNKTKMCGERIVLSYKDDMVVQIVRPKIVFGIFCPEQLDSMPYPDRCGLRLTAGKKACISRPAG